MEIIKSDLTVIGAGISGMCAAVAAARRGLKVTLVNDRPVLGGNASSEIGVGICGSGHHGISASVYAKEGGLVEEIRNKIQWFLPADGIWDRESKNMAFFEFIYEEENITLLLNTVACEVELDNARIISVKAVQIGTEKQFLLESPLYVDSSGDGVIARKAGAPYMYGREAYDEFKESKAPAEADNYTMGSTMMHSVRDLGQPTTFKLPSFAKAPNYDITKNGLLEVMKDPDPKKFRPWSKSADSNWFWEYGGQRDTIGESEEVALETRKIIYSLFDHTKNVEKTKETENAIISFISPVQGKRESRRFIGEHILTQNDISNKVEFEDAVVIGGWPMDIHAPLGMFDKLPASEFFQVPGMYNIPFRCLYSKNIQNLMFAGRNASATHVAFASTRVMGTGGAMGQAVGTAASLCKKYNIVPGEITRKYIKELQAELQKDDQTIIGIKEDVGLASSFEISASSEKSFENAEFTGELKLDYNYSLVLPVIEDIIDSFEVYLKNSSNESQKLKVSVLGGKYKEAFIPAEVVECFEINVAARFEGWTTVNVHVCRTSIASEHIKDTKAYIVFNKNKNISIMTNDYLPIGTACFIYHIKEDNLINPSEMEDVEAATALAFSRYAITHDSKLLDEKTGYAAFDKIPENICFKNVAPIQKAYSAKNVANGYSRPYEAADIWIADARDQKPELILQSSVPLDVNELHLIFNNSLETDNKAFLPLEIIRDYDVIVTNKNNDETVFEVRDNYKRLNKLKLNTADVTKITARPLSTFGSKEISIYCVKVF